MKLDEHIDKIAKVAEVAGKEFSIEQALNKMEKEWEPIHFEVLCFSDVLANLTEGSELTW